MRKTKLTLALAAIFTLSSGLIACSPEQQEYDPQEPQQTPYDQSADQDSADENGTATHEATEQGTEPASLSEQTMQTHEEEHAELQQVLRQYFHRNQADSREQCAMFEYGVKPCGGPERYIIYSQKDMSEEELTQLEQTVARFNQLDAFIKSTRGVVSNCQVTPEPEIVFRDGRCTARDGFNPVQR